MANGYNWDGSTSGNKIAKSMAAKTDWTENSTPGAPGCDLTKNNRSGFSALPAGYRRGDGTFDGQSYSSDWWGATNADASNAWYRGISYDFDYPGRDSYAKLAGFSVRLVRD
jgi:uncharacterized protein (TIGR02145 family)